MIILNCAACAAPLAHEAPRCVRCKVRYCDSTCQHDHWRRGHKQICKKIHRGGNAEQYHADKKYKEVEARNAILIEAKILLRDNMPRAVQVLGPEDTTTMRFRWVYAYSLFIADGAPLRDLNEAVATYEDIERVWLRRFGENHPEMLSLRGELGEVREERDRLQEESDKATMMAVALVAALAFLAGRRYLRR